MAMEGIMATVHLYYVAMVELTGFSITPEGGEYFAPGERFEADYILPDGISLGETAEGIPAFYNAAGTHYSLTHHGRVPMLVCGDQQPFYLKRA